MKQCDESRLRYRFSENDEKGMSVYWIHVDIDANEKGGIEKGFDEFVHMENSEENGDGKRGIATERTGEIHRMTVYYSKRGCLA